MIENNLNEHGGIAEEQQRRNRRLKEHLRLMSELLDCERHIIHYQGKQDRIKKELADLLEED